MGVTFRDESNEPSFIMIGYSNATVTKLGWRWQSRRGARGELAAERPSMAARARAREHGGGGSQEREGW